MFENLKQQIAQDLLLCDINNLDEYVYELHEILPKYLKQVPEQSDYEFYEFAAKFLQYLIDENLDILDNDSVCDVFIVCPTEICDITNSLSSQSGEDITSDIIKILNSAKSLNIVNNEEEAQIFLDSIFTMTNHDWSDMDNQYIHCNWNKVMLMTNLDEEIIEDAEDPENDDYVSINSYNDGIIFYDDKSISELEADGVEVDWYQGPGTYDTYNDFKPVDLVSDFPDKIDSDEFLKLCKALKSLGYSLTNNEIISNDDFYDCINDNTNFDSSDYDLMEYIELKLTKKYGCYVTADELIAPNGEPGTYWLKEDDSEEDDPNFGVDALFSFLCVTGPDSADQALEIIYNECGWVGHPEDNIEAGTDFPIYGEINQEEADWFNTNMNAIFEHYDGDPNEFALKCIYPEVVEDLTDDSVQDNVTYNLIAELEELYPNNIITYDQLLDAYNESGISHLISMFNVAEILDNQDWTIIEIPDSEETFKERFEDTDDDFVATCYKTTSNSSGKEIQISDDGSMARIRFEDNSVSEWLTIEYADDLNMGESRAYVDILEFNPEESGNIDNFEFLDEYMKY